MAKCSTWSPMTTATGRPCSPVARSHTPVVLPPIASPDGAEPSGPPDAIAAELLLALEQGDEVRADQVFDQVRANEVYTELIYPILYAQLSQ